jgi:hypothetical protein
MYRFLIGVCIWIKVDYEVGMWWANCLLLLDEINLACGFGKLWSDWWWEKPEKSKLYLNCNEFLFADYSWGEV